MGLQGNLKMSDVQKNTLSGVIRIPISSYCIFRNVVDCVVLQKHEKCNFRYKGLLLSSCVLRNYLLRHPLRQSANAVHQMSGARAPSVRFNGSPHPLLFFGYPTSFIDFFVCLPFIIIHFEEVRSRP